MRLRDRIRKLEARLIAAAPDACAAAANLAKSLERLNALGKPNPMIAAKVARLRAIANMDASAAIEAFEQEQGNAQARAREQLARLGAPIKP